MMREVLALVSLGAAFVVAVSCGSGSTTSGHEVDSGSGSSSGGADSGAVQCYTTSGSGSSQVCDWIRQSLVWCSVGKMQAGSCPSAGLVGCCITVNPTGSGGSCVHGEGSDTLSSTDCASGGGTWLTSPP
jgi:hypothetical protein